MAAYQGMFYIVARNSYYTARYLLCVNPVDNISGEIDGGGSYFTAYGATQIDLAGMGFGTNMIGSKDIIYQEGKLYILI